jgi:hypothetical protein
VKSDGETVGTQIIIDGRTKKVRASLDAPGSDTTIFAVDLIGDTWYDFCYFAEQARAAERAQELEKRNRYVRAAIAAMFSHFDGVVSNVVSVVWNDTAFLPYRPKDANFCALKSKVLAIHGSLRDHRGLCCQLPICTSSFSAMFSIIPRLVSACQRLPEAKSLFSKDPMSMALLFSTSTRPARRLIVGSMLFASQYLMNVF